ncbi:MAG: hypothetical protein JNK87_03580 [Bryobacterales bacterium]|nr:hypothetical protein [Bryobacterales bacterium]
MAFQTAAPASDLVLLAPGRTGASLSVHGPAFANVISDWRARHQLLESMQRFRGAIALEEGAVSASKLSPDGRHEMPVDHGSWHLLLLKEGRIAGCMRYAAHAASSRATDLLIWHSTLARSREWSFSLRAAIEKELAGARRRNFHFGEPGGWVIAPELRGSMDAVKLALGGFALAQVLGGAVGVCTATRKNHSAAILKRLGGRPLGFGKATLPPYYEPQYGCEIEILKFDSDTIAAQYRGAVQALSDQFSQKVPVMAGVPAARTAGSGR